MLKRKLSMLKTLLTSKTKNQKLKIALKSLFRAAAGASVGVLLLAGEPRPALAQREAPLPAGLREALLAYGVDPDNESSVGRFLAEGIPQTVRAAGLPAAPSRRLELFPPLMEIAGRRSFQSARAPLMRLLQADYSPGVQRIISDDSILTSAAARPIFLLQANQGLQLNAAKTLSLGLGETAAIPWIRRLWEAELNAASKISYALAGATLGDASYWDFLAEQAASDDPGVSWNAFQSLEFLSGLRFEVYPYTPLAVRRQAAERARHWVETRGSGWKPRQAEVAERFYSPYEPPNRLPDKAVSARDHLLLAQVFFVAGDAAQQARESRRFLGELEPERARQLLEPVARDVREDVDVRAQAILWLGRSLGEGAKPIMAELARDENPPVSAQAKAFLEKPSQ
jgi:hypothetical protein